jgi:hypothetical protein
MSDGVSLRRATVADVAAMRAIADLEHAPPDPAKGGFPEHGDALIAAAPPTFPFAAAAEPQE